MKLRNIIRKNLKKIAKRISFAVNTLAIMASSAQLAGVLALQSPLLQLKATVGILLLNAFTHHLKHPSEIECCSKNNV